jgi:hypothetical protein
MEKGLSGFNRKNNPHPKDLSKSPAAAGFLICRMMCRFGYD